ncbi:MAG: GIY-YIG nuclease family protein [Candidatus Nitrosocaldus sp.]
MKGVYALLISVDSACKHRIRIGSLGMMILTPGIYAYVGSAMNSLQARIRRHVSNSKRLRWHIDHLTMHRCARVINAVYATTDRRGVECMLSCYLEERHHAPFKGFGSSDCSCYSHFYLVNELDDILAVFKRCNLDAEVLYGN